MDDDRLPAEPGPPAPEAPNPDPLIAPPSTSSHARRGRGGTVVALALAAILLFGTGSLFGRLRAPESGAGPTASPTSSAAPDASAGPAASAGVPTWSLLDQAYELLRTNYVDPSGLDPTTLQQGAIRGLTDAVNDTGHTGYLTAAEVKARDQSLSGTFVGIGAVLDLRNNAATVVRVIPDSPAEKAGLRAGFLRRAVGDDPDDGRGVVAEIEHGADADERPGQGLVAGLHLFRREISRVAGIVHRVREAPDRALLERGRVQPGWIDIVGAEQLVRLVEQRPGGHSRGGRRSRGRVGSRGRRRACGRPGAGLRGAEAPE